MKKIVIKNHKRHHRTVSEIDLPKLHRYILNKISIEFSNMVENCYYPQVAKIFKDLLHMTNSNERDLITYSKDKYSKVLPYSHKFYLLHDPYTTLLIIIVQEFLKAKDIAAAQATFHLWALRYYTNALYKMTTPRGSRQHICNKEAFQTALDHLSRNHLYVKYKTIPNAIMHFSSTVFKTYYKDVLKDDAKKMWDMIYTLRTRIMQSQRSFGKRYYKAIEDKKISHEKETDIVTDVAHERKLKQFISTIVTNMCVYGRIDTNAIVQSHRLLKFNKKLSEQYAKKLSTPQFSDQIETALYLLLHDIQDISFIKSNKFLDYVQKLLAIKVTKQKVYFKKTISEIHDEIIEHLGLETWYNKLSIQSKAISRNFIAYYIVFYLRNYI